MHLQAVEVERRARDHEARAAARELLAGQPQLEPGAVLAAAAVVDGRYASVLDLEQRVLLDQAGGDLARPRGPPRLAGGARARAARGARPRSPRCSAARRAPPSAAGSGLGDGPEAVDGPAGGLAPHPRDVGLDAAQVHRRRGRLELERERALQLGAPAAARRLDRGAVGERQGLPVPEQDGRARPRRPVDVVGGVEEGQRKRRSAHRSSPRPGLVVLAGRALDVVVAHGGAPARHAHPGEAAQRASRLDDGARVGGSSSIRPTMSVMNPGVIRNAPPKITSTPSMHLAVRHPARRERLVEAPPDGAALRAQQQRAEHGVGGQQQDRPDRADRVADLEDHVQLRQRDHDEERDERQQRHALTLLSSCHVQL